ncbi:SHOCT domain-containing protein [Natronobacterium gregoryi]|uniref:Membrane protein n=2 Tax=Natronobacterium gregoryi TaxID=44930 RepID=L0AI63_NATGS|nr:hypothetical protein [Natronobacterium gregoryi]AFZ73501.1 putative membrane protein [Natronobacterium gregoryi SP2]ELY68354.1 hypothetical protein C490_09778 [Natronobacterium gregoryi SP2]PLK20487.1 hypothetical protein CYV19_09145 [Natronobacterium gregoryi SP2]SFI70521.1 hypothetical protein SAMN05443661_1042 [Natronobacterium gregoryi]
MTESRLGAGIALFIGLVLSGAFLTAGMIESAAFSFVLAVSMAAFFVVLGKGASEQDATYSTSRSRSDSSRQEGELSDIREQYARGQLTDQEFEHRVEAILADDGLSRRQAGDTSRVTTNREPSREVDEDRETR